MRLTRVEICRAGRLIAALFRSSGFGRVFWPSIGYNEEMTRKTVLFAFAVLLFMPFLIAGEEAAVEAAERAWAQAMEENDFDTLERVLADDLYYSHSNFLEDSKRSYIDNLKSGKARYYVLDIQSLKVMLLDDKTALTKAVAEYQTKAPDGSRQTSVLKTLHVYRKNNGQWQMVAHQSAKKPD